MLWFGYLPALPPNSCVRYECDEIKKMSVVLKDGGFWEEIRIKLIKVGALWLTSGRFIRSW